MNLGSWKMQVELIEKKKFQDYFFAKNKYKIDFL